MLLILYVALTRAREKLFVTGLVKNVDNSILKYSSNLSKFKIYNSASLLDWIGYSICGKTSLWVVNKLYAKDLIENKSEVMADKSTNVSYKINEELLGQIDKQMKWSYAYKDSTTLPNKVSISEIKRRAMQEKSESENSLFETSELTEMPTFNEVSSTSGTQFGTLIHSIMQRVDFKEFSDGYLDEKVQYLNVSNELKRVIKNKILDFSKTELFKDIANAKLVEKEKPFNLNIKAKELYNIDSEDTVMVQGIIDLFFVNSNDELILLDYKTDNVESGNELVDRYSVQLSLYKRALEEILSRRVSKTIIYSFKLGEVIVLNI